MSFVKISVPSMTPMGTVIEIDGVKQDLVYKAEVSIKIEEPVKLCIEKYVSKLEIEGNFEVNTIINDGNKKYKVIEVIDK